MRIVDLANDAMQTLLPNSNMRMLLSEGSQDMEGVSMGDVEHKSQVIIEDMGGRVIPGEERSEQDQTIFNTVLTSSGQIERQQMVTGIGGSSIVYESGSGNLGAIDYATGLNTPQRLRT
jgi:phosphatidylinositol-4,5-bisphosphate 4-phosphatase